MKTKIVQMFISLILFGSSCASLRSVSITQIPADRSAPIEAEASSWAVLGLYANNDFVEDAVTGLSSRCSEGKIGGIFTKYEDRNYFL